MCVFLVLAVILLAIVISISSARKKATEQPKPSSSAGPKGLPISEHDAVQIMAKRVTSLLDTKKPTKVVVFDVETNGLTSDVSVLSISAIKYLIDPANYSTEEIGRFERYYYPRERFNYRATDINGLTRAEIIKRRGEAPYPRFFTDDVDVLDFFEDTRRFVAHNIAFDRRYLPLPKDSKCFCTMMVNTDIIRTEYLEWKNEYKWPTLKEAADYYHIDFDERQLHQSMIDTQITAQIFLAMLKRAESTANLIASTSEN